MELKTKVKDADFKYGQSCSSAGSAGDVDMHRLELFLREIENLKISLNARSPSLLDILSNCHDTLLKSPFDIKKDSNVVSKLVELRQVINNDLLKLQSTCDSALPSKQESGKSSESENSEKQQYYQTSVSSSSEDGSYIRNNENMTDYRSTESITSEDQLDIHGKVGCPFCFLPCQNNEDLFLHFEEDCYNLMDGQISKGYAYLQIISGRYKCNICNIWLADYEQKEKHLESDAHIENLNYQSNKRQILKDVVLCSCCQEMVADSKRQISAHFESEIHKRIVRHSKWRLLDSAVAFILSQEGQVRCVACNANFNSVCVRKHSYDRSHMESLKNQHAPNVWCCVCDKKFHLHSLEDHEFGKSHKYNSLPSYSCLFCGEMCKGITQFLEHTKRQCNVLEGMRIEREAAVTTNKFHLNTCRSAGDKFKPTPFKFVTAKQQMRAYEEEHYYGYSSSSSY